MVRVSEKTFYQVRNDLVSYGIVVYDGDTYAIDYSVTALHLAKLPSVQKRVLAANRRGGMLSTIEGIMEWAKHCVSLLIRVNTANPESARSAKSRDKNSYGSATCPNGKPAINSECQTENPCPETSGIRGETSTSNVIQISKSSKWKCPSDLPYRVSTYKTHVISSDKSSDIRAGGSDLSAKELMDRLAEMEHKRQAVQDKRKSRGTLPDLCNLFESAWRNGQNERNPKIMPSRLVARHRALLKSQIIGPARDVGLDIEDFAYWCALHWDAIGGTYFKKAKSYPDQPAFAWFVRCLETYTTAYSNRDALDPTATLKPSQRVTAGPYKPAAPGASSKLADLEAQLRLANEENEKLRAAKGLPVDDDPVYARAIQLASRKIVIGKYEDDDVKPLRRKLPRKRK